MPTDIYSYNSCPVHHLNYDRSSLGHSRSSNNRLYGIEIEMDNFDSYEAEEADGVWNWLQDEVLGREIADAYYLPAEDGSIRSRSGDGAELKTVPLTKTEHTLFHWLYSRKQTKSNTVPTTYRHALRDMMSARRRWFPTGGAWTNRSCGMHITIEEYGVSRLTWCKVLYWVNRIAGVGMTKDLFLRDPTNYCNAQPVSMLRRRRDGTRVIGGAAIKSYHLVRSGIEDGVDEDEIDHLLGFEKYSQMRLKDHGLIEFRGFRSSLNPLTILRNIEVVESIIDFVQEVPLYKLHDVTPFMYGGFIAARGHHYPFLRRWFKDRAKESTMKRGFMTTVAIQRAQH